MHHLTFRRDINGLRAYAVLLVVLFHFGLPVVKGGFVGVDIFFVISGYLMTGILTTRLTLQQFSLFQFYWERCRRIVTALCSYVGLDGAPIYKDAGHFTATYAKSSAFDWLDRMLAVPGFSKIKN